MSAKVVRFPSSYKMLRKKLGSRLVECQISGRWLQFPEKSAGQFRGGEFIPLSVMTLDSNEEPRKLCEMVVTKEDLLKAINLVCEK